MVIVASARVGWIAANAHMITRLLIVLWCDNNDVNISTIWTSLWWNLCLWISLCHNDVTSISWYLTNMVVIKAQGILISGMSFSVVKIMSQHTPGILISMSPHLWWIHGISWWHYSIGMFLLTKYNAHIFESVFFVVNFLKVNLWDDRKLVLSSRRDDFTFCNNWPFGISGVVC